MNTRIGTIQNGNESAANCMVVRALMKCHTLAGIDEN